MKINIHPYRGGPAWGYSFILSIPGRKSRRVRRKSPVTSRSGTQRFAETLARRLLQEALEAPSVERKPAPTLAEFAPRWVETYAIIQERQKPSEVQSKRSIIRVHLIPWRGEAPMDRIDVQAEIELRERLKNLADKTLNNIMAVARKMFSCAVEWGELDRMRTKFRGVRLKRRKGHSFYTFEEFAQLYAASQDGDWRAQLILLLGGEVGLRLNEMRELRSGDLDWRCQIITIERGLSAEIVGPTKGGDPRYLPMTQRVAQALRTHQHLGTWVLDHPDGSRLSVQNVRTVMAQLCRRADVPFKGIQALRHSFVTHMMALGATLRDAQEAAGHVDGRTTQGYSHHSPIYYTSAIRVLDRPLLQTSGEIQDPDRRTGAK